MNENMVKIKEFLPFTIIEMIIIDIYFKGFQFLLFVLNDSIPLWSIF